MIDLSTLECTHKDHSKVIRAICLSNTCSNSRLVCE